MCGSPQPMRDCPGAVLTDGKGEVMCKDAGDVTLRRVSHWLPESPCRSKLPSRVCRVLPFLTCLTSLLTCKHFSWTHLPVNFLLSNPSPNICLERGQTKMQPFQLYHQFLLTVCVPPVANVQLLLPQTTSCPVPFRKIT